VEVDFIKENHDDHSQLHRGQFHRQSARKVSRKTLLGAGLHEPIAKLPTHRIVLGGSMQERQEVKVI
jgi:hypothetical protein